MKTIVSGHRASGEIVEYAFNGRVSQDTAQKTIEDKTFYVDNVFRCMDEEFELLESELTNKTYLNRSATT